MTEKRKKVTDLDAKVIEYLSNRIDQLGKIADKYEDYGLRRTKIFWTLKDRLKTGKKLKDVGSTYNIRTLKSDSKNVATKLNVVVEKLATTIEKLERQKHGTKNAALNFIRSNFVNLTKHFKKRFSKLHSE